MVKKYGVNHQIGPYLFKSFAFGLSPGNIMIIVPIIAARLNLVIARERSSDEVAGKCLRGLATSFLIKCIFQLYN